jgi:hypothetical protein
MAIESGGGAGLRGGMAAAAASGGAGAAKGAKPGKAPEPAATSTSSSGSGGAGGGSLVDGETSCDLHPAAGNIMYCCSEMQNYTSSYRRMRELTGTFFTRCVPLLLLLLLWWCLDDMMSVVLV